MNCKKTSTKVWWIAVSVCLLLSIVLKAPEIKEAKKFFSALTWIIFLFLITAPLFPRRKGYKHLIRIFAVVLLAPLGMAFIVAIRNAITAYISSAISQTLKTITYTYDEILLLLRTRSFDDLMSGKPFYLAIAGAMVFSSLYLLSLVLWHGLPSVFCGDSSGISQKTPELSEATIKE